MKSLLRIILILLLILSAMVLLRDFVVTAAIQSAVKMATGLTLKVERLHIGISNTYVQIKGLELKNPAGFEEKVMLAIPEIYVDYQIRALPKGVLHLNSVVLDLETFNVVKNAQGTLNLDSFKTLAPAKSSGEVKPKDPASKSKALKISIAALKLRINKVSYMDFSVNPPRIQDFNIGINESYAQVDNLDNMVRLIVVKALMNTSISSMTNLDLGSLQDSVSGVLSSSAEMATTAVLDAKNTALVETQKLTESVAPGASEAVSEAAGQAKELVGNLKGKIKLPFGSSSDNTASDASAAKQ